MMEPPAFAATLLYRYRAGAWATARLQFNFALTSTRKWNCDLNGGLANVGTSVKTRDRVEPGEAESREIDQIYDVAIDPLRLEGLVQLWSKKFDSDEAVAPQENVVEHVHRASRILEKHGYRGASVYETHALWVNGFTNAAFVLNTQGIVVESNAAAQAALQMTPGASIAALPFLPESVAQLKRILKLPSDAQKTQPTLLMLGNASDVVSILHVTFNLGGENNYVGIATSVQAWPKKLNGMLMAAFSLTVAEIEVLKDLSLGHSVRAIVVRRNRLEPTVRTQVRSLLEKTATRNQVELVRTTLALMEIVQERSAQRPMIATELESAHPSEPGLDFLRFNVKYGNQQNLECHSIGDKSGKPFFMLPTDAGFTRLTPSAENWLKDRGLRMIVPIRPGYGGSTMPSKRNRLMDAMTEGVLACADHLSVDCFPILSFADDFHTAVHVANHAPERVSKIIGVGAVMPTTQRRHVRRMPAWTRFVVANARLAPGLMHFVSLAIMSYAKSLGPKRFLESILSTSKPDLETLQEPEIQLALLRGDNVALTSKNLSKTWAAWSVANYGVDWEQKLMSCTVPTTLFSGTLDPFSPIETVREFAALNRRISLREYPGRGQLLYDMWQDFLGEVEQYSQPHAMLAGVE
jgi:pimeloyl-ACP methyl ester carboxylesterase/DNA-binding CsgD family transcriptional regulator